MPCSLLFQEGLDVHGELFGDVNPAMLRITNIQRLQVQYCAFICNLLAITHLSTVCMFGLTKNYMHHLFLQKNLKLILMFSVTVDGERKEGTISYELPQKPLFACLLAK